MIEHEKSEKTLLQRRGKTFKLIDDLVQSHPDIELPVWAASFIAAAVVMCKENNFPYEDFKHILHDADEVYKNN